MVDIENEIQRCVQVLEQGGVILYPTDTIWGLGCDATNEAAIDKVFALKQRPTNKSVILLLADERDLYQYVAAPPLAAFDLIAKSTSPTTIVYENGLGVARGALHEDGSIAIRLTKDPFCRALIKRFRKPIVSTSANISNAVPPRFFREIDEQIKATADYVVSYRQEEDTPAAPSAIFRVSDEGGIIKLR